jgi:diguanylate cyclase (GGDEF)-like protein/PAS domain S-box-containing protein
MRPGIAGVSSFAGSVMLSDIRPVPGAARLAIAQVGTTTSLAGIDGYGSAIPLVALLVVALVFGAIVLVLIRRHGRTPQLLQQVERDRASFESLYELVFESSAQGIMLTDLQGAIVAVNPAFVRITGYTEAESLGSNPRILQSGRQDETFYRDLWATVAAMGSWHGEIWDRRKDGEVYPAWLTISAVTSDQGQVTHYAGVFTDIGDVKRSQERLDFLATHDALTSLPNPTLFDDRIRRTIERASQSSGTMALLFVDIDRFGRVNDVFGHAVGDRLLQEASRRLAVGLGAEDTLARYVADKFVIVIGNVSSAASVAHQARQHQDQLSVPYDIDGIEVLVTCSVGISLYPVDGGDPATLLRLADSAMRQARARGGNTMAFVDLSVAKAIEEHLELERSLRGAAARNEMVVHYQPQVNLTDRCLLGVEALVRWQHPDRGLVPPGVFIPLAEEMGIIGEIDEWVLAEACRQLAAWQVDGLSVPRVAVNLSAQELEGLGLAAKVRQCLDAAGIGPERLEVEVTESMIMRNSGPVATNVEELHRLNVDLVMDDFGTGYSSLAQLRRLPVSRLKIDISFVRDIGTPSAEGIIRAIIAMASSLGLHTVAEGVEREDQDAFLREAGCHIGQGYLYGRPVPADQILDTWRP